MGKLQLSLDALDVQSFSTAETRTVPSFSPTAGMTYCSCPGLCKPHD